MRVKEFIIESEALRQYVHSDYSASYSGNVADEFPQLLRKFPFKGGKLYRGLNFSSPSEYLAFRRSIKDGYIESNRISSWGKTLSTGQQFARTKQVFNFLSLAPGDWDPNERVGGFIGAVIVVELAPNVGIDVNAAIGGAEDEVILAAGRYKIIDLILEKKWQHLLKNVDINQQFSDALAGAVIDIDKLRALVRLKRDKLTDKTKAKIVNQSALKFIDSLQCKLTRLDSNDLNAFSGNQAEYDILFPDGTYKFSSAGFIGLEQFFNESDLTKYLSKDIAEQIRKKFISQVNKATKEIDGKDARIKYSNASYFGNISRFYGLSITDFKYLSKNAKHTYERFNQELREYNSRKHFNMRNMIEVFKDAFEEPFS